MYAATGRQCEVGVRAALPPPRAGDGPACMQYFLNVRYVAYENQSELRSFNTLIRIRSVDS